MEPPSLVNGLKDVNVGRSFLGCLQYDVLRMFCLFGILFVFFIVLVPYFVLCVCFLEGRRFFV